MAIESDRMVSLPMPPPPRPAARREAIDAALRKFDGIENPAPAPGRRARWASMDRRSVGALATAAIVAAISIPVALVTLRDMPRPASPEVRTRYEEQAPTAATDNLAQVEPVAEQANEPPAADTSTVATAKAPAAKDERMGLVAEQPKATSEETAPASIASAAAPPPPAPPPPPPPAPAPQYTAESQDMVVTGSRIARPNLEDRANRQAKAASPPVTMDAYGNFLSRLQGALKADNRRAVSGMVGFPLTVNVNGRVKTYRSRREVESDFDKIFTPAVKAEVLGQKPYSLRSRGDGRTRGAERIWFAPACFDEDCSSAGPVLIREVTP